MIFSVVGFVELALTGANVSATMEQLNADGIALYSVIREDAFTLRFYIRKSDYQRVKFRADRCSDTLKIITRRGFYWDLKRMLRRPLILAGLLILMIGYLILPTRVLFFRVEGNQMLPEQYILEAANDCGIFFGASRREVRSEQMKNRLLEKVPQLKWAGINTKGCVAVISVKEREADQEPEDLSQISSIVAARDGVVQSCTATKGALICRVGQAVKAGEVLISAYSEQGTLIHATAAQGEVYAQTNRDICVVTPIQYEAKQSELKKYKSYSLILGKKRINFWKDSRICGTSCGRMYEEYCVTLPGKFHLPAIIAVETHICYQSDCQSVPEADREQLLSAYAQEMLNQQMIAGEVIRSHQVFDRQGDVYRLNGTYLCTEMIGRVRKEQLGEEYGKNS